jgi:hypothetical protein
MSERLDAEQAIHERAALSFKEASDLYETIVRSISWPRILLAATARHIGQGHEDDSSTSDYFTGVCGDCLRASMMSRTTEPVHSEDVPKIVNAVYGG